METFITGTIVEIQSNIPSFSYLPNLFFIFFLLVNYLFFILEVFPVTALLALSMVDHHQLLQITLRYSSNKV